jgi:hypothetical protein
MAQSSFGGFTAPRKDGTRILPATLSPGSDLTLYCAAFAALSTSPTKGRGFTFGSAINGMIRTSFSMFSDSATHTLYGQIYKNNVPVGTLRSFFESAAYTSSPTYTEDISVKGGDRIELWLWSSGGLRCQDSGFTVGASGQGSTGFISM